MRGRGAPKGGRVHWLLWLLPPEFRRRYYISYDYDKHNYLFLRYLGKISGKNLAQSDVYIVTRTSRRCWRVSSHDFMTGTSEYASFEDSQSVADYLVGKSAENEQRRIEYAAKNGQ